MLHVLLHLVMLSKILMNHCVISQTLIQLDLTLIKEYEERVTLTLALFILAHSLHKL